MNDLIYKIEEQGIICLKSNIQKIEGNEIYYNFFKSSEEICNSVEI